MGSRRGQIKKNTATRFQGVSILRLLLKSGIYQPKGGWAGGLECSSIYYCPAFTVPTAMMLAKAYSIE
jgi:hypothetical protein